jgi:hypothetical protein
MSLELLLMACTAEKDSSKLESVAESDTEPPLVEEPWKEAGFWSEIGPLEPLFSGEDPSGPDWEVRIATSVDGVEWVADERVIARGFSSLHLLVMEEGVILSGVVDRRYLENLQTSLPDGVLYALVSPDLVNWGSVGLPVENPTHTYLIDPGLGWTREGTLQAWWYGTSEEGDPATLPGLHLIEGSIWEAGGFGVPEFLYEAEGLADPSICFLGEERWLFATESSSRVVAASGAEQLSAVAGFKWEGVTVPFCSEEEGFISVLGQVSGGAQPPHRAIVEESGIWSDSGEAWEELLFQGNGCTSPVEGVFQGVHFRVCAMSMPG